MIFSSPEFFFSRKKFKIFFIDHNKKKQTIQAIAKEIQLS